MRRLLAAAALALAAARARAQSLPFATLGGAVAAGDGAPIAGVTVRVASPALQGSRETRTSRTGEYLLALLPPGDYRVTFVAAGMREETRAVTLPAAGRVRLDQVLQPAVASSVAVSSEEAPAAGPEIAANVPQKLLNQLPSGRALRDAALLAPGVNENGPASSLGSASPRPALMLSGAASYENLFLVNGSVVNENLRGQPQDLFIEDAIQETTIQTGRISAEYGWFMGGVVNVVTRSGGNQLSGSFRATLSSDQWTANNAYDEAHGTDARAHDVNGTYEGTLGFPILKDRIWAFGAARDSDVGQPFSTRPPPGNAGAVPVAYTYGRNERRLEGKLTAAPAPSSTVVVSYIDDRLDETNYAFNRNILSTETLMPRSLPYSLLTVNASGVVSSSLFVEAQYAHRAFRIEQGGPQPTDRILGTTILDTTITGGARFGAPQFSGQPPSLYDNDTGAVKASWLLSAGALGEHDLKAGYELLRESTLEQDNVSSSGYVVDGGSIVRGTQAFPVFDPRAGAAIEWNPLLAPGAKAELLTHSVYLNDRVSLGRYWSLNLGVRWDKNHDVDSSGVLVSDSGSLSPRLGVRWDPGGDGRLVFDAGYAKYVAKIAERVANATSTAGNVASYTWNYGGPCINCDPSGPLLSKNDALAQLFAWFHSIGGTASPPAGGSVPGFSTRIAPGGLRSPYTLEFSAGAEMALNSKGSLRADFLYRDTRDQYSGRIDLTTGRTPPDAFGNSYDVEEIGNSDALKRRYVALQLQAHYRFGARVSAAGTYTWSRLTGNFIGEYNCCSAAWGLIQEYPEYKQQSWNAPVGDITGLGVSPFSPDQRHRARVWVVFDAPVGKGSVSASVLEAFDSGHGYEAAGFIDPRPYVANPGYANPLFSTNSSGSVVYFFTQPGAFRTDNVTHTDLALEGVVPVALGAEVFVHLQVLNVFNEQAVVAVNSTVLTNNDNPSIAPFNPFTETPKAGVNYVLGKSFGQPTSSAGYQAPRTFQIGLGVRF